MGRLMTKSTTILRKGTKKKPKAPKSIFDLENTSPVPLKPNDAQGPPESTKLKSEVNKSMEKYRRGF